MQPFSDRAKRLILSSEGNEPPSRKPPGASGVTIGYGYDLGYVTRSEFVNDWGPVLQPEVIERLLPAVGIRGDAALPIARTLAGIVIPDAVALSVFTTRSLPIYFAQTLAAFPGADALPLDAQGALVSLVYNRGGSMKDSTTSGIHEDRREMRMIRILVSNYPGEKRPGGRESILRDIANQILMMRRIWEGRHMGGLITRREQEAALVTSSIPK